MHSRKRRSVLRADRMAVLVLVLGGLAGPAAAETVLPLGSIRSVSLRGGCGEVVLRHGTTQRVTLIQGNLSQSKVALNDDGSLEVVGCIEDCPRGYRAVLEILTPDIDGAAVSNGGKIHSVGSFPRQEELRIHVDNGGTVDLRSMSADKVTAAVEHGGRILTRPQTTLIANVEQGGVITYWGTPHVRSSVKHGGVIGRGLKGDEDTPLEKFGPQVPTLEAVPPVPPAPPAPSRRSRRSS